MSTAMTATMPNLEYSSDPASGTLHGMPTMPFGALAWSLTEPEEAEEPLAPNLIPAAPLAATRTPRTLRVALVAMVFGGVTVAAAVGAILLGGNDEPSTPLAVVDHTRSTPYVAPAPAPAPMPTANHVATRAPAPVPSVVSAPVVVPPKAIAPAQPVVVPPAAETPKPTHGPHWNWPRRIWQHHDKQDGPQDGQGQKR
ncbi:MULTISPECIES: hypothetical protein [unclassified Mycobacterium]|uniref:hypothetical protein n=1 Tax=unclassified Mycobacterium TaxID=2642494 RepID=UPI000895B456|nr:MULTISPECIES: hypothetical protein [unclassified Mycobacterium]SEB11413.1 hypothetical protein SAMN04488580_107193 [Mycobacterium sp. 283mftsu]